MRPIDADALIERMTERLEDLRKEFGYFDHYADGFEEGLEVVEYAETLPAPDGEMVFKWVSVEDRLPENNTYILAVTDGVVVRAYWHNGRFIEFTAIGVAVIGGVSHWMPLPEPPKCKVDPHLYRFNALKKPTNADRIRDLSDEELAQYLHGVGWDCNLCAEHRRLDNEPLLRGEKCDEKCVEHCLEWLKQPVEAIK